MIQTTEIKAAMVALAIGGTVQFPAERYSYIRVLASNLGLEMSRKYRTAVNRNERVITVTRES